MDKPDYETFGGISLDEDLAPNKWRLFLPALIAVCSYLLAFIPLYNLIGPQAAILAMLPMIVIAGTFGVKGGLIASLLSHPLNVALVFLAGGDVSWWVQPGGWFGYLGLIVVGIVVGRMADMSKELKQEIAQRQQAQKRVSELTFFDALTGMPNQSLSMDRLSYVLARSQRRAGSIFAVLLLDLDNFKAVNESLGPLTGDQVLVKVSQRLSECVRSVDMIGRLWGDEFMLLLDDVEDVSDALRVARRVQTLLENPIMINEEAIFVTASIGIAMSSPAYEYPDALLRDAGIAMVRARKEGGASSVVFDPEMHAYAVVRLKLENDLRGAIEREELQVFYQPLVSFDSGGITGFEALVRWQHPERGLLPPNEFLPVAEETGLMIPIDRWVLLQACVQLRSWQEEATTSDHLIMNVNLSGSYFKSPDLVRDVEQILEETGICGECLKLEINEATIINDIDQIKETAFQLKKLGVQLDVDDFGTGNSALSYLRLFPIRTLKLDRFFVDKLNNGIHGDTEIVQAIITLAHRLGLDVIGEGVETPEQVSKLRELGCKLGQGYLFSKPVSSKAAGELLSTGKSYSALDRELNNAGISQISSL